MWARSLHQYCMDAYRLCGNSSVNQFIWQPVDGAVFLTQFTLLFKTCGRPERQANGIHSIDTLTFAKFVAGASNPNFQWNSNSNSNNWNEQSATALVDSDSFTVSTCEIQWKIQCAQKHPNITLDRNTDLLNEDKVSFCIIVHFYIVNRLFKLASMPSNREFHIHLADTRYADTCMCARESRGRCHNNDRLNWLAENLERLEKMTPN